MGRGGGRGALAAAVTIGLLAWAAPAAGDGVAEGCKGGGWETLVSADGGSFQNQGACVSYVARGGTAREPIGVFPPAVIPPQTGTAPAGTSLPFTTCSSSGHFSVSQVTVTPQDDGLGLLQLWGAVDERVTSGTAEFTLSFLGTQLIHTTLPLEELSALPAAAGHLLVSALIPYGSPMPSGTYVLQTALEDQNDNLLTCVGVTYSL